MRLRPTTIGSRWGKPKQLEAGFTELEPIRSAARMGYYDLVSTGGNGEESKAAGGKTLIAAI